jgi:mannitol/fructose-specific phosphotransferase system IIA component (Ntr-type)
MDEVIERDVVTALIPIIQSSCDSQLAAMDELMKLFSGSVSASGPAKV